jgi:hypothetical protein
MLSCISPGNRPTQRQSDRDPHGVYRDFRAIDSQFTAIARQDDEILWNEPQRFLNVSGTFHLVNSQGIWPAGYTGFQAGRVEWSKYSLNAFKTPKSGSCSGTLRGHPIRKPKSDWQNLPSGGDCISLDFVFNERCVNTHRLSSLTDRWSVSNLGFVGRRPKQRNLFAFCN